MELALLVTNLRQQISFDKELLTLTVTDSILRSQK